MGDALGPVDTHERVEVLDVLRGFALGGVFLANVQVFFSGRSLIPPDRLRAMSSPWDNAFWFLFGLFISQKFVTIFTALFGIGFSIQLLRAEERGASIVRLYSRRLGALLLIGLPHMLLLWHGEVLTDYALVGFVLLSFRRRSDRTVVTCALLLVFLVPLLYVGLEKLLPLLTGSGQAGEAMTEAQMQAAAKVNADALAGFSSGSYLDVLRANLSIIRQDRLAAGFIIPVLAITLGKFLLGFYAGRRRLLHAVAEHRQLFRRLLFWGLVAGVLGNVARMILRYLFVRKVLQGDPWRMFLMPVVGEIGFLGLAAVYVSAITLLFQRLWWRRLLSIFAPAGRMALTNYLSQTILGMLVYYGLGLGLIGKVGPWPCFGITMGLYALQLVCSRLWLSRFRFGPAEWVWRSMTYGNAQPMRIAEVRAGG